MRKVAIVIPTKNNPNYIHRQLRYYEGQHSPHPVYIGDSSDDERRVDLERIIQSFQKNGMFSVLYKHYPISQYTFGQCVKDLLTMVGEPHVVFCGDDDFQIPTAISRGADFLASHSEYSTVHGRAAAFTVQGSRPYGSVTGLTEYLQGSVEVSSASQRLIQYLSSYSVLFFSVQRTEEARRHWEMVDEVGDHVFASEFLPFSLAIIQGKSKLFNEISFMRQIHDTRTILPGVFEWITAPQWSTAYATYLRVVSEALARKDGISLELANECVKQAFWAYLQKSLSQKWQQRYGDSVVSHTDRLYATVRFGGKNIPVVRRLHSLIQSFLIERISLPSLLNPRSPYHTAFLPIYTLLRQGEDPSIRS